MPTRRNATLIGLTAVVLWSSIVGLIRSVAGHFGATGGAALIYTAATALMLATLGPTRVRELPRRYLVWGSVLFVCYELCLCLSIGYARSARQAIEVGMVNYLWPSLTMLAAIVFNRQCASLLVVPGFVLAMLGIAWVLGGDAGPDLAGMLANVGDNPLSYGLALAGALIWAAYCTVTVRIAQGRNAIVLFFALTAAVLWIQFAVGAGGEPPLRWSVAAAVHLALAGGAMGLGYAAWNVGILHGNVTVMAGASYFIPVLSAGLSALILRTTLPPSFWVGAAMVCAGSILCWLATRRGSAPAGPGPGASSAKAVPDA